MLDTRLVNVSKEMTNITSMQTMIDFCMDRSNLSSTYLKYDLSDTSDISIDSGDRNVFDYKVMSMMLKKLKIQYEDSFEEIKDNIEKFIEKNIEHFLTVCPIDLISNPSCNKNILLDISKGKYSDIKVKSIHSRNVCAGESNELLTNNAYSGFSKEYGSILAKIVLNIRKLTSNFSKNEKPNLEEICLVFANGFRMNDSLNMKQPKKAIFDSIKNNEESIIMDCLYNCPNYDKYEATVYRPRDIYREVSTHTLNFLSKSFQTITKGIIPFSFVKKDNSITKNDLKRISLYIDYENEKRKKSI